MKGKNPPIPAERKETLRQKIIALLRQGEFSAKDISMAIGIREKDVYLHLENIQQSCRNVKKRLNMGPAVCKKCGFVFQKRTRLTKPSRCPVCRGSSIEEPTFSLFEI